jgi:hypothetical protein
MSDRKPYYYVAGPYTALDSKVQEDRETQHCVLSAELLKAGYLVYSPIAETANLAKYGSMLGTNWDTWREKDLRQLEMSDGMIILTLPGWEASRGLRGEIKYCIIYGIPMFILSQELMCLLPVNEEDILEMLKLESADELND